MSKRRVRIKDIAEEAQVSRGTVDRVLHNRGRVAPEAVIKVKKAIERLGYSPNIIARTLAHNKEYRIATLIPYPDDDVFWKLPYVGIQRAYEATKDFGIHIEQFFFKMDDPKSFENEANKLVKSQPDAILMATEFYREAIDFYDKVKAFNIPMVGINTHIKELDKVGYIGQDSYQGGKLAGKLFDISLRDSGDLLILHLGASMDNAMHIMDKERGLSNYFDQRNANIRIIKEEFGAYSEPEKFSNFLKAIFRREQNIKGIFVTNSRAHYLMDALDKIGFSDKLCVVGFDLIEENCALLRNGKINFLINQDPMRQGNLGLLTLVDHLLFQKNGVPLSFLPLDVVVAENVDMYLNNNIESFSEERTNIMVG